MSEPQDRFLREAEVAVMTTLSRAQRWRLELRGEFPARIRLGGRTVVWSAREIEEWMQSRPRARYLPQGAILGPQHGDDKDMPGAVPRPTADRAARQPAKPRQLTAS
jgi:predicted DNA-binding transcriptional regulator AlpA